MWWGSELNIPDLLANTDQLFLDNSGQTLVLSVLKTPVMKIPKESVPEFSYSFHKNISALFASSWQL